MKPGPARNAYLRAHYRANPAARLRLQRRWRARIRRKAEIHAAWASWIGGQRLRMAGVRWGRQPAFPHDSWALR